MIERPLLSILQTRDSRTCELFCFASPNDRSRVPGRKFQRFAITAIKNNQYFPKSMSVRADRKLWISVSSHGDATAYSKARRSRTFILKPDTGCQGRGIYLTKHLKDIKPSERLICQVYIARVRKINLFPQEKYHWKSAEKSTGFFSKYEKFSFACFSFLYMEIL